MCRETGLGSLDAEARQDVAEGGGGRDRRARTAANDGREAKQGRTPQGGGISPLLANLYMNRFLKHWRRRGKGEEFRARLINYADDFVILSRGRAAEALEWTQRVMGRIGLTLNQTKTRIVDGHHRRTNSFRG
jgi:RNA-directed DNA polymerase